MSFTYLTQQLTPTDSAAINLAAQQIAATRDYEDDGIFAEEYELSYWISKCNLAAEKGLLLAVYVNGGQIGAAVALPLADPAGAVVLACDSVFVPEESVPVLEAEVRRIAAAYNGGTPLWKEHRETVFFVSNQIVFDYAGVPVSAEKVVTMTYVPF